MHRSSVDISTFLMQVYCHQLKSLLSLTPMMDPCERLIFATSSQFQRCMVEPVTVKVMEKYS